MKDATILFTALGVSLLLPACSRFDPGEQTVQLVEKMADVIDRDKTDCNKMGSELDSFIKDNDASLKKIKEYDAKSTPEQKKEFEQKYKPRVEAATKKMLPGMMACATNAKVQEALKTIPK